MSVKPGTAWPILDCFERSDSGKAFNAALAMHGLLLANGDRRDCFVVIDREGGHHALNKKLTGHTLAETRKRLGDIDRAQLPKSNRRRPSSMPGKPPRSPASGLTIIQDEAGPSRKGRPFNYGTSGSDAGLRMVRGATTAQARLELAMSALDWAT
jgi:hypothetical protein